MPRPWQGETGFSPWWSRLVKIPKRTGPLTVRLGQKDAQPEFELHFVSPLGRQTRAEGRAIGVRSPEPGKGRVAAQSVWGGTGIWLEPKITPERP